MFHSDVSPTPKTQQTYLHCVTLHLQINEQCQSYVTHGMVRTVVIARLDQMQ